MEVISPRPNPRERDVFFQTYGLVNGYQVGNPALMVYPDHKKDPVPTMNHYSFSNSRNSHRYSPPCTVVLHALCQSLKVATPAYKALTNQGHRSKSAMSAHSVRCTTIWLERELKMVIFPGPSGEALTSCSLSTH
jgi:hypothetical protein